MPESILVQVCESLLGILDMDTKPDDFTVEGAINLMNKCGQEYEKRIKKLDDNNQKDRTRRDQYDAIFGKFAKFRDMKDEDKVNNEFLDFDKME